MIRTGFQIRAAVLAELREFVEKHHEAGVIPAKKAAKAEYINQLIDDATKYNDHHAIECILMILAVMNLEDW